MWGPALLGVVAVVGEEAGRVRSTGGRGRGEEEEGFYWLPIRSDRR